MHGRLGAVALVTFFSSMQVNCRSHRYYFKLQASCGPTPFARLLVALLKQVYTVWQILHTNAIPGGRDVASEVAGSPGT